MATSGRLRMCRASVWALRLARLLRTESCSRQSPLSAGKQVLSGHCGCRKQRGIALEALPTRETAGVAKAIMNRVYLRGKSPRVWQSDNAKEFTSEVMKELAKLLGAKFKHSSPYHPQTNTHVERYNRTIATHLSLMVERLDQRDWDEHLKFVEYANLVGAQAVLGKISPAFLNGGWEALDPLDRVMHAAREGAEDPTDRKSTRLNSSHQ